MKKNYYKIISIFLCLVLFITIAYNDKLLINKEIYGVDTTETIDLTSIATGEETSHDCSKYLISKYDSSQHWQECSICGNVYGTKTNHSFVDNGWTRGTSNDCNENNVHKFTCNCGYSYSNTIGRKEHNFSKVQNLGGYAAYETCYDCNQSTSINYHKCKKADGSLIYGENLGICAICGYNYTYVYHHAVESYYKAGEYVKCFNGENLAYVNENKYQLNSVGNGTMITDITVPSNYQNINNGYYDQYTSDTNVKVSLNSVNIEGTNWTSNQTITYIGHSENVCRARIGFMATKEDGCAIILYMNKLIYPENEAPLISLVNQEDISSVDGWSTQKKITIKGTENYCRTVNVKIKDSKGNIIANGAAPTDKTITNNYALGGNWSFTFTPVIETDAIGEIYTIIVTDSFGYETQKQFTIKQTDSKAPTVTSANATSQTWSKTKDFTVIATDNGAGNVQIAFNNISNYGGTIQSGTSYSKKYTFTGDVYGSTVAAIYLKDAVGNESTKFITIYNLDNTKPTITNVDKKIETRTNDSDIMNLTVTANDKHATLGEGSGVSQYNLTTANNVPTTDWQDANTFSVTDNGTYYLWVKDNVGNISQSYSIVVTELTSEYTVKHWQSNIGADKTSYDSLNYTLVDTDILEGKNNTKVTPDTKNYEGFTAPAKQELLITSDGKACLNYYYERNSYKVTLCDKENNSNGIPLGTSSWMAEYQSTVSGSYLGISQRVGDYYSDYKYDNCTSTNVGLEGATVYRFFKYTPLKPVATSYVGDYDGKSHSIGVICDGATITYSTTKDGTYSSTKPTFTDAGTYTVYYKASASGYTTVSGSATVTINKIPGKIVMLNTSVSGYYPTSFSNAVTTNLSGGTLNVSSSNDKIATATIVGNMITITPYSKGTAVITVTSAETTNYKSASTTFFATVKNGTLNVTSSDYSGTYDGNGHSIHVSPITDATIQYSVDNIIYTDTIPKYTDAGTYTTYFKVTKENYEDYYGYNTVVISKADNILTLSDKSGKITYPNNGTFTVTKNISNGELNVSSDNPDIASANISGNTITIIPGISSGTTTITVTSAETKNYNKATATYTITVEKGKLTVLSQGYNGTYDGYSHGITVNCPGAIIKYAQENEDYSLSNPTFTNAGSYTVNFKVEKAGYEPYYGSKTVTIGKAQGVIELQNSSGSIKYPESTSASVKITKNLGGGIVIASSSNDNIVTVAVNGNYIILTPTGNVGTSIITVTASETTNYTLATTTYSFNVSYSNYDVTYIDVVDEIGGIELGRTQTTAEHNTMVRGEDMGSLTTDNNYYPGYYYTGEDTKATVDDENVTIYRIFKQRMVNIPLTIKWIDNNNKFASRPKKLQLTLRSNKSTSPIKTITIEGDSTSPTQNNIWQSTFGSYPMYDNSGEKIIYTIVSSTATSLDASLQYDTSYSNNTNVITNTLSLYTPSNPTPGTEYGVTIKGNITWKDENNKWTFRPQSVDILLYRNGIFFKKVTVNEGTTSYEFTGLPRFDDDEDSDTYYEEYVYTIVERAFDNYSINYIANKSSDSITDALGNTSVVQTTYVNIINTFKPVDGQTIRNSGYNELIIYPVVINQSGEEAMLEDFERLKTDREYQNVPVIFKQLNLVWKATNVSEGKYIETYSGYSGLTFNAIVNMDKPTTVTNILPGKYEIIIQNDNEVFYKNLKLLSSERAKFTEEDGRYYVTFSYLDLDNSYIEIESRHEIAKWAGYKTEDYSFSMLQNYSIK